MALVNNPPSLGKKILWAWSLNFLLLPAQRYVSDTLYIRFYSDAPLEKIQAENTRGSQSWIDFSTDSVYVRVKIRSFSFPNKLMEEHFNENYMESERYPYAYFQGKLIAPFSPKEPGTYAVSAKGLLTIHGVTRERLLSGTFEVLPS
ncbi:MAG: YceI family protein, partial [Bacteroidia bacterium]|nr:YceI family protein [Bacteroidia bacterium]